MALIRIKRRQRQAEEEEIQEQETAVDGRNLRPKVTGSISRRLSHTMLPGNLLIRRFHGRTHWQVMYAVGYDGSCADGMQALLEAGLELDSHKTEFPVLVRKDDWLEYQD